MTVRTEGYGRSLLSRAALIYPGRIGKSALRLSTAAMLAGTLVLAGCGGGSDSTDDTTMMPPPPTAFEEARAAINAATSAADAQTAYDEVDKEAISGAEAAQLMAALDARLMALRAASQQSALMTLSAAVDTSSLTSQADVDAANAAIAALQMAVDNAVDVSDADKAQYIVQLNNARDDVNRAVASIAEQGRIADQKTALMNAADAIDTSDLSTTAAIAAAGTAIDGLQAALDAAVDVSDADKEVYETQLSNARSAVTTAQADLDTMGRQDVQRTELTNAYDTAKEKVDAVDNESTELEVSEAENAVNALEMAIADADDLSGDPALVLAMGRLEDLQGDLMDAKTSRQMAKEDAEEEARQQRFAAAMKLYIGISAPMGDPASPAATDRAAAYNAAGNILVSIGDGTNTPTAVELSATEAVVDAFKDWKGKSYMYTVPADTANAGTTYEAVVYSDIEPDTITEGRKFGSTAAVTEGGDYEYQLTPATDDNPGELTLPTTGVAGTTVANEQAIQARIESSSFDQSAGTKPFESSGTDRVMVSGKYHGVAGTFYCTPAADNMCAAQVAANGFALGGVADDTNAFTVAGGTWRFKPSNPEATVMNVTATDTDYASYGWWIRKSANDSEYTASAFVDDMGTVPDASGITALQGTAKYVGGAAGQYALQSSTGGTNDAGSFTANATLDANFRADTITGTINGFTGADGESRSGWSVELMASTVSDTGTIAGDPDKTGNTDPRMTVWTIDGESTGASGSWSGSLKDNGEDGVPKVATGTFYTEFGELGNDGKMVGAFGANKQ